MNLPSHGNSKLSPNRPDKSPRSTCRGAVLIIALMLLPLLTLPAHSGLQRARLQAQITAAIEQRQLLHNAVSQLLSEAAATAMMLGPGMDYDSAETLLPDGSTGTWWITSLTYQDTPVATAHFRLSAQAQNDHSDTITAHALYHRTSEHNFQMIRFTP